jgi:hypothetical protein
LISGAGPEDVPAITTTPSAATLETQQIQLIVHTQKQKQNLRFEAFMMNKYADIFLGDQSCQC